MAALVVLALVSPFVVLLAALFRGAFLFYPVMILMGAVHSYVPAVPALGWQAVFFIVALLSLLIPTSTNTTQSK